MFGGMKVEHFNKFCEYISNLTTIDKNLVASILITFMVLIIFSLIKNIGKYIIRTKTTGRTEYVFNQLFRVVLSFIEIVVLIAIWSKYIQGIMTLISVGTAAMTIALRELILNFFCGIYIKVRKPFKVEDRIEIDGIKGDVMNISVLDFEVLEISNKDNNGQSTGIVISFPNSIVFSKPVKNINKGFKYIWEELVINVKMDCDLVNNKKEIYRIVNELEVIKNIPKKMKAQISSANMNNRVYFNKYDPIIYTKLVEDHVELTVRYLMHPKKSRYVESVIWNKIYLAYKDGKIDLYTGEK